jgi:hypothetical protein
MKTRIRGFPTQAIVEQALILGEGFLPPFWGYVFKLKFQGPLSKTQIGNIKNLNIVRITSLSRKNIFFLPLFYLPGHDNE